METNVTRRKFLGIVVVLFGGLILWLAGCGGSSREGAPSVSQAPVPVTYGATLLDALVLHAAQDKTVVATRQHSFGKEVVEVGGRKAIKGTAADDGFVVLVDGQNSGVAVDQTYLHTVGVHTIEVRHVPFGKRGENVKPFLTFSIDVR